MALPVPKAQLALKALKARKDCLAQQVPPVRMALQAPKVQLVFKD